MQNCNNRTTISRAGYCQHLKIIAKQITLRKWEREIHTHLNVICPVLLSHGFLKRQNYFWAVLEKGRMLHRVSWNLTRHLTHWHQPWLRNAFWSTRETSASHMSPAGGMAEKHSLDEVIQTTVKLQHIREKNAYAKCTDTAGPYPAVAWTLVITQSWVLGSFAENQSPQ